MCFDLHRRWFQFNDECCNSRHILCFIVKTITHEPQHWEKGLHVLIWKSDPCTFICLRMFQPLAEQPRRQERDNRFLEEARKVYLLVETDHNAHGYQKSGCMWIREDCAFPNRAHWWRKLTPASHGNASKTSSFLFSQGRSVKPNIIRLIS